MENKKYTKPEVIEPEIFDENGRKITQSREFKEDIVKEQLNPLRRAFMGVLGTAVALLSGFMMLCVFIIVFAVMAIPMLILSLFGRKPNIKVFKYKI